jgi:hypothetical protein
MSTLMTKAEIKPAKNFMADLHDNIFRKHFVQIQCGERRPALASDLEEARHPKTVNSRADASKTRAIYATALQCPCRLSWLDLASWWQ